MPPISGALADQASRMWALQHGFVRVNFKPSSGNLTVEVDQRFWTAKTRAALVALVDRNAGSIDFIAVNITDASGRLLPASESVNLTVVDDEDKAAKVPVVAGYVEARWVAEALKRFKDDVDAERNGTFERKFDRRD